MPPLAQQAAAFAQLEQFDEAIKMYDNTLAEIRPKEVRRRLNSARPSF